MARLKSVYLCSRRETDLARGEKFIFFVRGRVLIGPEVTAVKPEAG